MRGLNPIDAEDLFDHIILNGVQSPGIVTLSGHDRPQKWDVKSATGSAGASTTYQGEEIAKFTATFKLVKDSSAMTPQGAILSEIISETQDLDEFAEWDEFQPLLEKSLSTKPPTALPIYHPDLIRNSINIVSVEKIGGMVHDGKGGASVTVSFLEFRPPKKKGGSPKGKDPNADVKKELDAVVKAAKAA